jgi:hypothetical protein
VRATEMSIFTKPLSQIVTADLQELLDENAIENVRLEFKLQVPNKDENPENAFIVCEYIWRVHGDRGQSE